MEALRSDGRLAGSLLWSMFGHAETFGKKLIHILLEDSLDDVMFCSGHVTHNDGYSIYWPTGPEPDSFHHNNPAYR